jgi:hypothetical protein
MARKSVSRKSVSRKSVLRKKNKRNKSKRRQRRITRQIGGDISDMETYILGLKGYTPDTRTEEEKWIEEEIKTDKEKVIYAGALVSYLGFQDESTLKLPEVEKEQKKAFKDGLKKIYAKYNVTDEEIQDELDYLKEEGLFNNKTDEDDKRYDKLMKIAQNIYKMFVKVKDLDT